MRLRDLLRGGANRDDDTGFTLEPRDGTVAFTVPAAELAALQSGTGSPRRRLQFMALEALAEQGVALPVSDGFVVADDDVAALDPDEAAFLGLPEAFSGTITGQVRGATTSARFTVELQVTAGKYAQPVRRTGPFVEVGSRRYRLSPSALTAVRATESHAALTPEQRTETRNVRLLAELRQALDAARQSAGDDHTAPPAVDIDLRQLAGARVVRPERVGLLIEQRPDGGLDLQPDLGSGVDPDKAARRWHHLDETDDGGVLRVDADLVLLDEDDRAAVTEVRTHSHIPAEQVEDFFRAPGDFVDPELVDVELGFGVRVKGIGRIAPVTFAKASETGISWLGKGGVEHPESLATRARTLPEQTEIEKRVEQAWARDRDVVTLDDEVVDIADHSRVREALEASRRRLEELGADLAGALSTDDAPRDTVRVGMIIADADDLAEAQRASARGALYRHDITYDDLKLTPFPHQRDGIEWMTGLMRAALAADADEPARVQGAILADDMGLGKTFMTLVALRESLKAEQADPLHGPLGQARPTLAVLPVALLENWLDELDRVFPASPFDDVVVLQGDGIKQFRMPGARRETVVGAGDLDSRGMVRDDVIVERTSLRIGAQHGETRLDRPNRLVLTTYSTLQRYQISLGQVDWGVVVLDEAQNTKNPETLAARAAKGLRARFKLLATGTPVENELKDFWSLTDTAQPGLLGTYADFRTRWVAPMDAATGEAKAMLGRDLRAAVGPYMLRRVKEDHLSDLPSKSVHRVEHRMPQVQVDQYDAVLHRFRAEGRGKKGAAFSALHGLRSISLHPFAGGRQLEPDQKAMLQSARMVATLNALDDVRRRAEKAIVFVIDKGVQRALSGWLHQRYGLYVSVVNGDTAATSAGGGATRKALIRRFEEADGFNVIIMSPLAVGVGLTVVGANHAIHLERHWNPAKEAQATDRIYRIGQTRDVHVYLPMALHPDRDSFDVNLDRLLETKTFLKDAVVAAETVAGDEMLRGLGLNDAEGQG